MTGELVAGHGITKQFGRFRAGRHSTVLRDVNVSLVEGETLALVGESGSGKTTTARIVLGLIRPTTGNVSFRGRPLGELSGEELRSFRRSVQFVPQDPSGALNPRKTIGRAIAEPLSFHGVDPRELRPRVCEALERVSLTPGDAFLRRYPRELSGGQRQRVLIARALALRPACLVADEPVASLDVSVKAQVLNLFREFKRDLGLGALVITHDLGSVRAVADRVAVMQSGSIVEEGAVRDVFLRPQHDYTRALLDATPRLRLTRTGEPPREREAP